MHVIQSRGLRWSAFVKQEETQATSQDRNYNEQQAHHNFSEGIK